jgi:triacylglycerol lipase
MQIPVPATAGALLRRAGGVAALAAAVPASRLIGLAGLAAARTADPPARWRGAGPVVLVGGFCAPGAALGPMRRWLECLGYEVVLHTAGAGMGCAGRSVEALSTAVARTADDAGAPVRLVAHSRGGQFARVAARRDGAPVRALVTLGSPFDLYDMSLAVLVQAALVATAGSLGAPGLARLGCLRGTCCEEFRDGLRRRVPVPFTSIYSRSDRAVPWRASADVAARNVEVTGGHLDLLTGAAPLHAVAEALAAAVPAAGGAVSDGRRGEQPLRSSVIRTRALRGDPERGCRR